MMKKNVYPKYLDKGPEVAVYQRLLAKTGSTIKVNGVFTIGMTSAIKAFQKKNGLKVTGKIDAMTDKKLKAYAFPKKQPVKKCRK